mmetsp:Transcript_30714/g.45158  ORF Transcript_30714/g.45158 Transcript_30714/m.45158 type:complete len:122 (+) Transcript_30714:39-404(+)
MNMNAMELSIHLDHPLFDYCIFQHSCSSGVANNYETPATSKFTGSQAVHQGQSCCREGFLLDKLNLSRFTSVRYGVQWSLLGSTRGSLTGCFLARSTNSFLSAEMKYTPFTNLSMPNVFRA